MNPQASIVSTTETISPMLAAAYLSTSKGNRNLRPLTVKKYADLMTRGEWMLSHQGIAFNLSGHLIDGHHRLSAVVKSGVTVRMTVARNAPHESYVVIDGGANRTVSDVYMLPREVASVAGLAGKVVNKIGAQAIKPIIDGDIPRTTIELLKFCGAVRKTMSSTPIRLAAVLCARAAASRDAVFSKYRIMVLQEYASMDASMMAFNKHAVGRNWSGGSGSAELLCRAIMAFSNGTHGNRVTEENTAKVRDWAKDQVLQSMKSSKE